MSKKAKAAARDHAAERRQLAEMHGMLAAIDKTQLMIEYALDGTILRANERFLKATGYRPEDIQGKHHRMFVEPAEAASPAYARFWEKLARGEADSGRYKRFDKAGAEVWIQASYIPVLDADGKPFKVVNFTADVTEQVKFTAENARIKSALDKSSASVMVADDSFRIIYVNEAAQKLFREAQADFRRELPGLDAEHLVGSSIDVFHKDPAHQRQLLASLRGPHSAEIQIAGRFVRIVTSPVVNAAGERFGTVIEWFDRTQEVHAEQQVSAVVQKAIEGNLLERVPLEGKSGFLATLAGGLNQMLENVAQMVGSIKLASVAVQRGAEEIAKGNENLSQRTEQQSSSLEETASSMEQMTSTVKHSADNAGQANQLAVAAREQAEKGGEVVGQAVKAMGEINDASKKIADIIGVIDEIAFQTNLLALNAAVEAARAGEQGRGFAVVATEVRSLAGRSATAAKEIKGLIKDSVQKVEQGSRLVTQSGDTLEQIVLSVKKVSDIIAEIAAAAREQSAGIEQVNKAVMQMDSMTQQNAALVEQATSASQSMTLQARELSAMMERYRSKEPPAANVPKPVRPAVAAPAAAAPAVERRGPSRPFSAKAPAAPAAPAAAAVAAAPKTAPSAAPAPAARKVAAKDRDSEWQEF